MTPPTIEHPAGALPCPFCGADEAYWNSSAGFVNCPQDRGYLRIVCMRCGSGTTTYPPDARDKCLAMWNSRSGAPNNKVTGDGAQPRRSV